jgi:hypothetical protein
VTIAMTRGATVVDEQLCGIPVTLALMKRLPWSSIACWRSACGISSATARRSSPTLAATSTTPARSSSRRLLNSRRCGRHSWTPARGQGLHDDGLFCAAGPQARRASSPRCERRWRPVTATAASSLAARRRIGLRVHKIGGYHGGGIHDYVTLCPSITAKWSEGRLGVGHRRSQQAISHLRIEVRRSAHAKGRLSS